MSKLYVDRSYIRRALVAVVAISLSVAFAMDAQPPKPRTNSRVSSKMPIHIEVQDGSGVKIAGSPAHRTSPAGSATLAFDHEYQPGDRIVLTGSQRVAAHVDGNMPECLLYLADPAKAGFSYEIPYGREEKQTGSAYAPESFAGKSHKVEARALTEAEVTGYRNLALNPCDLLQAEDAAIKVFPHASTNSYSRNLFDFAARNAIDGAVQNGHHGTWPYQSWGPGLRLDLWWKLEFGRPVDLDKIRLMVRSDFPHDSYWKSAVVEFSDGSLLPIEITNSPEFQEFSFPKRQVSWFRINNLVPTDPARWCALMEVEAWGHDLP